MYFSKKKKRKEKKDFHFHAYRSKIFRMIVISSFPPVRVKKDWHQILAIFPQGVTCLIQTIGPSPSRSHQLKNKDKNNKSKPEILQINKILA